MANHMLSSTHPVNFSFFRKGNQYYFGAVHGELDYYFFVGDHVAHVLNELTQLTGRTLLKPKYVFGYHQGGYGPSYNNKWSLLQVALQYREAKIPCDGMHVDVDFQNNYRTFTYSPTKFPNPKEFFNALHDWGYKVRGYILYELRLRDMFYTRYVLEKGSNFTTKSLAAKTPNFRYHLKTCLL